MKQKFNIKIFFFLLAIIFQILTIFSITGTYARYITSLSASSFVEFGRWLISVNNQDITNNPDLSAVLNPVFDSSDYISEGKVVPASTGTVEINLDYSKVTVPFKYDIFFTHNSNDNTAFEDFVLTSYTIDDGEPILLEENTTVITGNLSSTDEKRTRLLKLHFTWRDGEGEILSDTQDTAYSRNVESLALKFELEFTQLQSEPTE